MIDNKIARICWNTEGWRKPSGIVGKSINKKTHECKFGYGHEEWLLDSTKLIDGWHYSHLEPISLHRSKYIGERFNISLYSINSEEKSRWWVGKIKNVIVITPEESQRAYQIYMRNGWIKEMKCQIKHVGADLQAFQKSNPKDFFVLKFKHDSLKLLDTPLQFSSRDSVVKSTYYNLLNQEQKPKLMQSNNKFIFRAGHKNKKSSAKSTYGRKSSKVDLVHNRIQTSIHKQLIKEFGNCNVGTEVDTGLGSQVDIVVKEKNGSFVFYEIKTSYSVRLCIREALSQLLEYAYYPDNSNSDKLIIVSPNPITVDAIPYLNKLRNKFNIPIFYQRYDSNLDILDKVLY